MQIDSVSTSMLRTIILTSNTRDITIKMEGGNTVVMKEMACPLSLWITKGSVQDHPSRLTHNMALSMGPKELAQDCTPLTQDCTPGPYCMEPAHTVWAWAPRPQGTRPTREPSVSKFGCQV